MADPLFLSKFQAPKTSSFGKDPAFGQEPPSIKRPEVPTGLANKLPPQVYKDYLRTIIRDSLRHNIFPPPPRMQVNEILNLCGNFSLTKMTKYVDDFSRAADTLFLKSEPHNRSFLCENYARGETEYTSTLPSLAEGGSREIWDGICFKPFSPNARAQMLGLQARNFVVKMRAYPDPADFIKTVLVDERTRNSFVDLIDAALASKDLNDLNLNEKELARLYTIRDNLLNRTAPTAEETKPGPGSYKKLKLFAERAALGRKIGAGPADFMFLKVLKEQKRKSLQDIPGDVKGKTQ